MSSTRPWVAGAVVASLVIAVAGWFLLVSPERSKASDLKAEKVSQASQNDQLRLDIATLKDEFKTLPAKQAELAVIKRQMPNNPGLPTLIRSLTTLAKAAGVSLTSVAPGTPTALTATAGATGTAAAAPTAGSTGVVAIPVTVQVTGSYAQTELFLQKLQNTMTRVILVSNLQIAPGEASSTNTTSAGDATTTGAATTTTSAANPGDSLETSISGQIFVLPDAAGANTTAGSAAVGSAAAGTTTATAPTGSAS